MADATIDGDKHAVELGIPARSGFKEDRVVGIAHAGVYCAFRDLSGAGCAFAGVGVAGSVSVVDVLATAAAASIVNEELAGGIGLIDVVEAAEVNAANVLVADVDGGVGRGLKFDRERNLGAVGIFVEFVEADDGGGAEEAALGESGLAGEADIRERNGVGISAVEKKIFEADVGNGRRGSEGKKFGIGICGIFVSARVRRLSSAGGNLAAEKRRGNGAVEEPGSGANYEVLFGAEIVGDAEARIDAAEVSVKKIGRPRLEVVTQAGVNIEFLSGAEFFLDEEAFVSVMDEAGGLVVDGSGNAAALINRSVEARLSEIVGLIEALKEDDEGMGADRRGGTGGDDAVVAEESAEIGEVGFKGIEKRKGFLGADEIEIAAEGNSVAGGVPSEGGGVFGA